MCAAGNFWFYEMSQGYSFYSNHAQDPGREERRELSKYNPMTEQENDNAVMPCPLVGDGPTPGRAAARFSGLDSRPTVSEDILELVKSEDCRDYYRICMRN